MYVIEVERQDGFTGYVYEISSYGTKYLDAPASLPKRKLSEFELAQVEQVVGETFCFKGQQFRRIDGFPVDRRSGESRVLPDDDILSNYLLALNIVQSVEWSDIPVEQFVQVASIMARV